MKQIGLYQTTSDFSTQDAGTAEWCTAERDGKRYFIKKFHTPVYPSKEIGLPEKMYKAGVEEFHAARKKREEIYRRLRESDQTGVLVVPLEVFNYQFHICTVAEFVDTNLKPDQAHLLSEWQKLVLLRTLTLALMTIHKVGVVHSDMRPENIMLHQDPEGHCRLRVIDFDGSFLEEDPPLDSEDVVGDPAYFSPEAYRLYEEEEVRLDHRIDVFALGMIFHYFWCGKLPGKPADQTVGECLLRGGEIEIDSSVPLVLRQVITRMLAVKPEDRISLKSVYEVLGVQLDRCPAKLVCLVSDEGKNPPGPGGGTGANPSEPGGTVKREVRVECVDEDGKVIRYRMVKMPTLTYQEIESEKIDGHLVVGETKKNVFITKGYGSPQVVQFTYRKTRKMESGETIGKKKSHGFLKFLGIAAVLFAIYWGIHAGLAYSCLEKREYDEAQRYFETLPFSENVFGSEYDYLNGIIHYRRGDYFGAVDLFRSSGYKKASTMRVFCLAHIDGPETYYQTIYDNIDLEDAAALLAMNDDVFCKYMEGEWTAKWTANGSSKTQKVTMTEKGGGKYNLDGMPELSAGSFCITDGTLLQKAANESSYHEAFKISIVSKTRFNMRSLDSGISYIFTRNR